MANSLRSSSTSGDPHCWAGSPTSRFPAATRRAASARCTLRSVEAVLPYSRLRLAKPVPPSGRPALAATATCRPSPAPCVPLRTSTRPPERSSLSRKLSTPAMASDPYWAAAPSRSTSICRRAMAGMVETSGPCAPSATPLPSHEMTAPRWRRLPFTSTSVWSGAIPRRLAGRTTAAMSPSSCGLTWKDGSSTRNWSARFVPPWRTTSAAGTTSMGTVDSVTDRGRARLPTTTTSSSNCGAAASSGSVGPPGAGDPVASRSSCRPSPGGEGAIGRSCAEAEVNTHGNRLDNSNTWRDRPMPVTAATSATTGRRCRRRPPRACSASTGTPPRGRARRRGRSLPCRRPSRAAAGQGERP